MGINVIMTTGLFGAIKKKIIKPARKAGEQYRIYDGKPNIEGDVWRCSRVINRLEYIQGWD